MSAALESTDAKNRLEDLSGVALTPGENPYHALIAACSDDPVSLAVRLRLRCLGRQPVYGRADRLCYETLC